jgi:ribosomal protein L37AE/L43A
MLKVGVISRYELGGGCPFVCVSSKQVEVVKAKLQQSICPECRKQILIEKTVLYCPSCKHQYDKNQSLQMSHTSLTESFRVALK